MGLQLKTRELLAVLIVMVTALGGRTSASVCDNGLCNCTLRYRDIATIDCRCNETQTGLKLTAGDFDWRFRHVRDFHISDCDGGIVFKTNAFRTLGELENLSLENIGKVEFEFGVFQNLTRLSLRNIQEIDFGERAFMGAHDLRSIEITRATALQLRSLSLYDIRGLHSLEMSDVTLHSVGRDAVNIELSLPESRVLINNCTIGGVEYEGIVLRASNFSIVKSAFDDLSSKAIDIKSSDLVLITESDFRSVLPINAINVLATVLDVRSNTFSSFPTGFYVGKIENEDNGKLIFTNNTIHSIGLEGSLENISDLMETAEIRGNRFPCYCFVGRMHQVFPNFSRNNFCTARQCNITLSDFSALVEERKVCTSNDSKYPDENEICANMATLTSHSPRVRTPAFFRTIPTPSTITITTNNSRNISNRIESLPVVVIFTFFAVIFKL